MQTPILSLCLFKRYIQYGRFPTGLRVSVSFPVAVMLVAFLSSSSPWTPTKIGVLFLHGTMI
jgi:hypothetical protein